MRIHQDRCERCGKTVDNHCAESGWLVLRGPVSRYRGYMGQAAYASDYLRGDGEHDFCSVACFVGALDDQRQAYPQPPADACRACGRSNAA